MTVVKSLGNRPYLDVWQDMQAFTRSRDVHTEDEIWVVEHPPVYTQGTSCHDLPHANPHNIPVVHTDRGGKMTYHGPGQLVAYLLFDIKRLNSGPRSFVRAIENLVVRFLSDYSVTGEPISGAPGVYAEGRKIAALGLRISRGRSYHGLSINVDTNLEAFADIDPCGFQDLEVTNLCDWVPEVNFEAVRDDFIRRCGDPGLFR